MECGGFAAALVLTKNQSAARACITNPVAGGALQFMLPPCSPSQ